MVLQTCEVYAANFGTQYLHLLKNKREREEEKEEEEEEEQFGRV